MKRTLCSVVALALLLGACGQATEQPADEEITRRIPQFENDDVEVWKSIILPNQPLRLHRHENGRALIALTDGSLKVINEKNEQVDTYEWKAGNAYWLDKDPPGVLPGGASVIVLMMISVEPS